MNDHGVTFGERWPQLIERVEAIRAMWTQEQPSYQGKFVKFDPLWLLPKPVQRPHPPIMLGTLDTPFGRAQVAKHGDAWLPLTFDVKTTPASVEDVKRRMRAIGGDPSKLDISLFFLDDREQDRVALTQAVENGAGRAIVRLVTADESNVPRQLDRYAMHALR